MTWLNIIDGFKVITEFNHFGIGHSFKSLSQFNNLNTARIKV